MGLRNTKLPKRLGAKIKREFTVGDKTKTKTVRDGLKESKRQAARAKLIKLRTELDPDRLKTLRKYAQIERFFSIKFKRITNKEFRPFILSKLKKIPFKERSMEVFLSLLHKEYSKKISEMYELRANQKKELIQYPEKLRAYEARLKEDRKLRNQDYLDIIERTVRAYNTKIEKETKTKNKE